MKLAQKKAPKQKRNVAAKKKQSFDFKGFQNSLNSLNKDNYGSAPVAVRAFIIVLIVTSILAVSFFTVIKSKREEIKSAEAQQQVLLDEYKEKESKARYLDEYRDQVAQMRIDFDKLLNQLPTDTRVSELIEGINMIGSGSGVRFQDIIVEDEIEQEFFVEQPIRISAVGEYHQFGGFLTGVAALPRIITMHDFEIKNPQPSLDMKPQLQFNLSTKTYRSKPVVEETTEQTESTEGGN